jgi:uncharacterized protein YcbK (DUF882 family)
MPRLVLATFALAVWALPAGARADSQTAPALAASAAPSPPSVTAEPKASPDAPPPPIKLPAAQPARAAKTKKSRKKTAPPPPAPAATLLALNTHETYLLRPDHTGRFTRAGLRGWNHFLRCHHTGRVHAMSTRLAQLIYEVDKHFDWKRVIVVAGYRAPRIAREKGNPKSPHKKGVACDFRIEGVPNSELRDYERTLPHVGVGYYPNSEFVHLDVDPLRSKRSAFWIDYSRPGERARYSKNPEADLENEERTADNGDVPSPLAVDPNSPTSDPSLPSLEPLGDNFGGDDPQAPLVKGARDPNAPPPIFAPAENR